MNSDDGSVEPPRSGADGAPPPTTPVPTSTDEPARKPDGAALGPDVVKFRLARVFLGGVPGCDPRHRIVVYEREARTVTWPGCVDGGAPTHKSEPFPTASRALTPDEVKELEAALSTVEYREIASCQSHDGLEYFMTTTTAAGDELKYSSRNVNCYNYRSAPRIEALIDRFMAILPKS